MEVILLENIEGLGKKGASVKVRDGFARNCLLPTGQAMQVTPDNLYRLRSLQKKFVEEESRLVKELRETAKGMDGLTITFTAKATEEGHLFGSISPAQIAQDLLARGFKVADRGIKLAEPIKFVGTYPAVVHLHAEVSAQLTIVVDSEDGPIATEETVAEGAAEGGADAADAPAGEAEAGVAD